MRQMEELIHVSQTLEFDKLRVKLHTLFALFVRILVGLELLAHLFCKGAKRSFLCLCLPLQAIPIISQTRYLEKKGELQEMSKGGTLFNMRAKFIPVYLFLFNDLLIIAAKKG